MIKAGIVGATGYGGGELIRLLLSHPQAKITAMAAKMDGKVVKISDILPALEGKLNIACSDLNVEEMVEKADFFFLALPHKVSLDLVPQFLKAGKKVVDFSADYRFDDSEVYEEWYQVRHTSPELLKEAVYGLPELYRDEIGKARLIANPGCYPTGVVLGVAPLLSEGLIDTESIIADSKSGVSGGGRWPGEGFNFCEIEENFKAYKIAGHRHQPEMEQELSKLAKKEVRITFTPHLLPVKRGILTTLYLDLKKEMKTDETLAVFRDFYKDEPFIKVLESDKFPEIKNVCGTNFCHIGAKVDERTGRVIVISTIDNLVKGASGQAVQNMNIMCGFNEKEGLEQVALIP
ncbi:N-acetyl-gamma-glutamyl-phosphate reductase [bacterium]|nr:N-acetyl-gamma-glutamyl-phosphate reductase [bacterium]